MRKKVLVFSFAAMSLALVALAASQAVMAEPIPGDKIGIVLMHGKGGTINKIDILSYKLKGLGILVETPLMPWSEDRIYDKGYEKSMEEIDTYVARLKAAGAKRIFVAGHSIGANAALGYAARRKGLSGAILLAYGHVPGITGFARKLSASTDKANAMIMAGKGDEKATFADFGGGNNTAYSTANDLFSWFDPYGPATMNKNGPKVSPNTPVLCVDGEDDKRKRCERIFRFIHENPKNGSVLVDADHVDTPMASFKVVEKWLRAL